MIKLNNKNITYVALADSNNSLKAPKEIWYADSNNSVKLVYRRKDALIEGEDYEKYHWLKGDGTAYIDTLLNPSFGDELNATFTFSSKPTISNISLLVANDNANIVGFITGGDFPRSGYPQLLIINKPAATTGYIEWGSRSIGTTIKDEYYMYMKINNAQMPDTLVKVDGVICNKDSAVGDIMISEVPVSTYKIGKGYKVQTGLDTVKLKNVTISSKINLTPCKLLKPVPKWLDANGIRRQVGECGMIDKISGKFYGNVNSVGTFTVENYYERKEWLVGDGSAYIDTGHNVNEDLDYETKVHLLPNTYLFWYRSGRPWKDNTMVVRSNTSAYIGTRIAKNSSSILLDDIVNVEAQWNDNEVSINGVNYTAAYKAVTFNYELYLFYAYLADSAIAGHSSNNVKCAYFRFLDSNRDYIQNLIPCTLTMDLPASMDANNIARTKGTSGMWDLVSDRFYGNVASNGTFKAVNLAEGVDYEVHDWLIGDGSAYIEGVNYNLWDNNLTLQIGKVNYSGNFSKYIVSDLLRVVENRNISPSYLMAIFRQNSDSLPHIAEIRPYSSMPDTVTMDFYIENSLFYCNQNGVVKTNDPAQTAIESTWKSVTPLIYSMKMSYIREVLSDGSYRSNLIPVKLLRSIPSKYDANGIARQAGECGMYDTINDVFYGNVASSGTFSVSDDS